MPPRAGSRSTAGTGGRSGASSLRSSSHPPGPATTRARTSPPPCRSAFDASSSNTSSSPSRASSVEPEETDGCAMRARRSDRTRETTCMASSCQCQTSPGTDGTGTRGHASWAGCSAIASPSRLLRRRGRDPVPAVSLLTDAVSAREGGPSDGRPNRHNDRMQELLRDLARVELAGRTLEEVLGEIVAIADREVPGAESTSITLLRADKPFTAAHHGAMSLAADELQYEHGHGPCMDAGRGGVVLRVDDMRTETRWPDYVAHV